MVYSKRDISFLMFSPQKICPHLFVIPFVVLLSSHEHELFKPIVRKGTRNTRCLSYVGYQYLSVGLPAGHTTHTLKLRVFRSLFCCLLVVPNECNIQCRRYVK